MTEILHFFKKAAHSKAIVNGRETLGLCGEVVEPQIEDGHLQFVTPTGRNICGQCLTVLNSKKLGKRQVEKTMNTAVGAPES